MAHREPVALDEHAPGERGQTGGRRRAQRAGDRATGQLMSGPPQLSFLTPRVTFVFLLTTAPARRVLRHDLVETGRRIGDRGHHTALPDIGEPCALQLAAWRC